MARGTLPQVREKPNGYPEAWRGDVIRLKLRVDLYVHEQTIEWSLIAWRHPEAHLIRNDVEGQIGFLLGDVALTDICAAISSVFDEALGDRRGPVA
jgi:hypothetical protein